MWTELSARSLGHLAITAVEQKPSLVGAVGRAAALQAEGRGLDSRVGPSLCINSVFILRESRGVVGKKKRSETKKDNES